MKCQIEIDQNDQNHCLREASVGVATAERDAGIKWILFYYVAWTWQAVSSSIDKYFHTLIILGLTVLFIEKYWQSSFCPTLATTGMCLILFLNLQGSRVPSGVSRGKVVPSNRKIWNTADYRIQIVSNSVRQKIGCQLFAVMGFNSDHEFYILDSMLIFKVRFSFWFSVIEFSFWLSKLIF